MMLSARSAFSTKASGRSIIRGLCFFAPSPLGRRRHLAFSFSGRVRSTLPLARHDPHHIGQVRPLVAPPLLDGHKPLARGIAQGVARRTYPHPGPRRDLAQGQPALLAVPRLVGDDPQRRQLARREQAGRAPAASVPRPPASAAARWRPACLGKPPLCAWPGNSSAAPAPSPPPRPAARAPPPYRRRAPRACAAPASPRARRLVVGQLPAAQSAQRSRAKPSSTARDFVPLIAASMSIAVIGPSSGPRGLPISGSHSA